MDLVARRRQRLLDTVNIRYDVLYLSALSIYTIIQIVIMTQWFTAYPDFKQYMSLCNLIVVVLCLFRVCSLQSFNRSAVVFGYGSFCLAICTSLVSHATLFLYPIILIVCAMDVSYRNILKTLLWVNLLGLLIVVTLSFLGIIPSKPIYRPLPDGTRQIRQTLGFNSPNNIGVLILSCILCYYLLYGFKRIFEYIILLCIEIFLLVYVNSRASFVVLLSLILISFIHRRLNEECYRRWITGAVLLAVVLFPLVCLVLSFFYKNTTWFALLDSVSSNRISYGHYFLSAYDFTLFGQPLELISTTEASLNGTEALVLDNSYLYMFMQFGIVFLLFVMLIYTKVILKCSDSAKTRLLDGLLIMMLYCIFENALLRINVNPLPLVLFASLNRFRGSRACADRDLCAASIKMV